MSKHNYTQYSNKKNNNSKPRPSTNTNVTPKPPVSYQENAVVVEDVVISSPEIKMVAETVNTVTLPKTVDGVVANCAKLNVRAEPKIDAEIICVLEAATEIEIDVSKSTAEWFSVCTATGAEGYCMRKFVDAHL